MAEGAVAPVPTEAERQRIVRELDEHGYALGPRVLTSDQVAELAAAVESMANDPGDPAYDAVSRGDREPFLHRQHLCTEDPRFEVVYRSPALISVVQAVLGEHVRLFEDRLFHKPSGERQRVRSWHQDHTYIPVQRPVRAIGTWVALADAGPDSGAMVMLPGSHRWEGDPSRLGQDLRPVVEHDGRTIAPVVRPVPAGHVHLHDPRVWHASGPNLAGTAGRAAISLFFVERDARYDSTVPYAHFFPGTHGEPLDDAIYPVCS